MVDDSLRKGIGDIKPYIPGKSARDAKLEFNVESVVKLASNENPFGPSPKAVEAMKETLKALAVYPDQTSIELREALSTRLGVDKDCLIVGNGSDEIMQLAAATFLSAGEECLISENTFSVYEFATKLFDGEAVFVPLKDYKYDLEGFARAVTDKTKLVWLCNPNNPTGTAFSQSELDQFLAKLPKKAITIIDEAYMEFAETGGFPESLEYVKKGKNVIVLRTFSKFYGLAGLRVGYGAAKPDIVKYMNLAKLPFNVNRLAVKAGIAALDDKAFAEKTKRTNSEGKKHLYAELKKLGVAFQRTEANFIFIDVKRNCDKVFMEMMRQGVIIRPLASFGFGEAIRVSIGTGEQNMRFIEALKKVLRK